MSEDAVTVPDPSPRPVPADADADDGDEGAEGGGRGGGGGRGCLPVLVGLFLLLFGAFLGTRFAKRFPVADAQPTTAPVSTTAPSEIEIGAALATSDRPPVELHHLIVCGWAEEVGKRVDLHGVVAELRPIKLPLEADLTVAVAISAADRTRRFAIRGYSADQTRFLEEPLELDPVDPRRPLTTLLPFTVKLSDPSPLVFEVITDDGYLVGRRILAVRLRPTTEPAGPSTRPAPAP